MKKRKIKLFQQLRYLCLAGVCILGLITIIASSGGDEEGGAPVNTDLPLTLNSGNALGVTGLTMDAAEGAVTAASIGTGGVGLSANSSASGTFEVSALRVAQDVFSRVFGTSQQTAPVVWGIRAISFPPNNPYVDTCSGGVGSVTMSFTDNGNPGVVDIGDSAIVNYSNCDPSGAGLVLNGEVTIGVLNLQGDPPTIPPLAMWIVKFRLNFNTLTANDGTSTIGVFGTLDVTVTAFPSGLVSTEITTEVSVGGGGTASSVLSFEEGSDFIQLTLFTLVFNETTPSGDFSLSAQGTLESSLIGGTVEFVTTVPLTGTDFDNSDPTAGELQITGAANATILLVATPPNSVELQVDVDGDGNSDVTIPTSWNELDAAADVL